MNYNSFDTKQNTILRRIAAGDAAAVEDCINAYGNLVWALAKKLTPRLEDAEDAVQEIFTEIWQKAGRYDAAKAAEITFIAMIARRRLIDRLRKNYCRPNVQSIEDIFETAPNVFESVLNTKIEAERAIRAMNELRCEQRELMILNFYEGMSHDEIASQTGLPLGTVKTHIRRGLARLRKVLSHSRIRKADVAAV